MERREAGGTPVGIIGGKWPEAGGWKPGIDKGGEVGFIGSSQFVR